MRYRSRNDWKMGVFWVWSLLMASLFCLKVFVRRRWRWGGVLWILRVLTFLGIKNCSCDCFVVEFLLVSAGFQWLWLLDLMENFRGQRGRRRLLRRKEERGAALTLFSYVFRFLPQPLLFRSSSLYFVSHPTLSPSILCLPPLFFSPLSLYECLCMLSLCIKRKRREKVLYPKKWSLSLYLRSLYFLCLFPFFVFFPDFSPLCFFYIFYFLLFSCFLFPSPFREAEDDAFSWLP